MPKMRLQGCASMDPAGEAYNALPDPLAGFGGRFAARRRGESKGKGGKGEQVEEMGGKLGSLKLCIPGGLRGGCAAPWGRSGLNRL